LGGVVLCAAWYRAARARALADARAPRRSEVLVGFVTGFFDTLGIGSFAPTTALFKLFRMVPDELIPGTLNIGHAVSVILQSLIFITAVAISPALLASMVCGAAVGAWFGAGVVAHLPPRTLRLCMGTALLVAGTLFAGVNLHLLPGGGEALALGGWRFFAATGAAIVLGALMTVGIGMYAPTMIVLALLGMHPLAAFPIMMGACALLQSVAGVRFVASARFSSGAALGLTLGDVPGVLIAAFAVKSLPLEYLRWLVVVVVAYAAFAMLRGAGRKVLSTPP
jgi:uncharacterized membrane protein YfcA